MRIEENLLRAVSKVCTGRGEKGGKERGGRR